MTLQNYLDKKHLAIIPLKNGYCFFVNRIMKKIYGFVLVGLLVSASMVCAMDSNELTTDAAFSQLGGKFKRAVDANEMHRAADTLGFLVDKKHSEGKLTQQFYTDLSLALDGIETLAEQIAHLVNLRFEGLALGSSMSAARKPDGRHDSDSTDSLLLPDE